ncbi:MAG: 50S ribosomal protein L24 [Gammaproteobacteria bacterium]|nr:50S ribosomal protein L24 [Gammaproteobacteria bacterium]MDC0222835.1 50S ribosomal protein L24 [Gammaproteobacteria bacterium]RZO95635.1 MAG: 50S ribosomal protein L24 [Gammaproteobacteria bacterium]
MKKIKKGDQVIVLSGKDKGRTGTVLRMLNNSKVLVENINIVKKHQKGNPNTGQEGGIIEKEMPIHISNVMLLNPITNQKDKVGIKTLEDGTKVRFFKSNNEVVDI